MAKLTTSDMILLLDTARNLAAEIQKQNQILQNASILCLNQMQGDSLSVLYASRMLDLLDNLKAQVIPPLARLVETVDEDYKWLDNITKQS